MLQKGGLSIMFWEQVLPMQTGFTAQTMTTLAWSASSEQLWSWGEAASEGKVALQRQNQVSYGVMSARLFGGGMKGVQWWHPQEMAQYPTPRLSAHS